MIYAKQWGLTTADNQAFEQNSPAVEGGDLFGWSLAAGKFTNFGGVDSLAIGAPGEDSGAGAVNVIYGSTAYGLSAHVLADQMWYQVSAGIHGASENGDHFGRSLAAGKFAGRPGLDALAIGVPYEDSSAGAVAVLYPETNAVINFLRADRNQLRWQGNGMAGGAESGDHAGYALAAGDFDANGSDDLAAGARWEDNTAGAVNVNYAGGERDTTAPRIDSHTDGPVGSAGWFTGDVDVRFTVSDPESPVDGSSGCQAARVTTDGTTTLRCRASSAGGTSEHTVTIRRDATAPVIRGTRDGANAHGWNNSHVTVDFACSDEGSGVAACTPGSTVTTEGANQIVRGRAVDRAGNVAYDEIRNINIDRTSPIVVANVVQRPNGAGWHRSDVDVEFTCSDELSGVERCSPTETLTREGANQLAAGQAVDLAGNVMITDTGYINIDKTPPQITATREPAPDGNGEIVSFQCSDALSQIASCSGDQLLLPGSKEPVYGKASDGAGNGASIKVG